MSQTHYDILGVARTATNDEIKAAYRKLCMQTHPDVASSSSGRTPPDSAERFKRISEAYSVLRDAKERRRYDYDISADGIRDLRDRAASAAAARRGGGGAGGGTASFGSTLPRNVLIGGMLGVMGVTVMRSLFPKTDEEDGRERVAKTGQRKLVEAWRNPQTQRWEKPRPWDPTYQRLKPALKLVPREEVHDGER